MKGMLVTAITVGCKTAEERSYTQWILAAAAVMRAMFDDRRYLDDNNDGRGCSLAQCVYTARHAGMSAGH